MMSTMPKLDVIGGYSGYIIRIIIFPLKTAIVQNPFLVSQGSPEHFTGHAAASDMLFLAAS